MATGFYEIVMVPVFDWVDFDFAGVSGIHSPGMRWQLMKYRVRELALSAVRSTPHNRTKY